MREPHDERRAMKLPTPHRRWLRLLAPVGVVSVLVAGGGLAATEADTVPTYWDGVMWALSLMTTVGFIGGAPTSAGGRLIAAVLMLFGFVLLAFTTAAVASLFVHEDEAPVEADERAFEAFMLEELRALRADLGGLAGLAHELGVRAESVHDD